MSLSFLSPTQPVLVATPPSGAGWIHEIKQDGYRTQVIIEGGIGRAFSRRGHDWSEKYRLVLESAVRLKCRSAIIDGEMIVPNAAGASDYAALLRSLARQPEALVLVAFDLLHLDGEDLRKMPLEERRRRLHDLIATAPSPKLVYSQEFEGDGSKIFTAADRMGLEGIVSKRLGSTYTARGAWLKTKAYATGEFAVVGVEKTSTGAPSALLAAEEAGGFRFVGNAFVTLPGDLRTAFWEYVDANKADRSPVGLRKSGVTWLRPGLRATARFLKGEGMLRHATLTGLLVSVAAR